MGTDHVYDFTGTPSPMSQLRMWLRDRLAGLRSDTVQDTELLVTELVTNANEHASGAVAMRVKLPADRPVVRIEVDDADPDLPPPRHRGAPAEDEPRGRGLLIVKTISTAWGVLTTPSRKTVWVEIPLT
jgi:anti-sigma regulatory factor (Ser/Thr protein kinase)